MNKKIRNSDTDRLFEAILTLQNIEECYNFFDDLCTVPEIKAMAQRFAVARLLDRNEKYNEIVSETGASTATISRVNRSMIHGNGSYERIFQRLNPEEKE